jgi:hypothetical protein
MLAALTPGLAGATSKKATLSVRPPTDAKAQQFYPIRASGYSDQFNRLLIVASKTKCPENAKAALASFFDAQAHKIEKQHNFDKTEGFIAGNAGKRYACAYLFVKGKAGGAQKRKSKAFAVAA